LPIVAVSGQGRDARLAATRSDDAGLLNAVAEGRASLHSAAMRRSAVILVMLLAMLWQSVTLARPGSTVNALTDTEHASLHWQGQSHHHHGDGSYHLDDSSESSQHMLIDNVSAAAALWPGDAQPVAPSATPGPAGVHDSRVPSPTPQRLLRPPRSLS
jgi:hypothetical protein